MPTLQLYRVPIIHRDAAGALNAAQREYVTLAAANAIHAALAARALSGAAVALEAERIGAQGRR